MEPKTYSQALLRVGFIVVVISSSLSFEENKTEETMNIIWKIMYGFGGILLFMYLVGEGNIKALLMGLAVVAVPTFFIIRGMLRPTVIIEQQSQRSKRKIRKIS